MNDQQQQRPFLRLDDLAYDIALAYTTALSMVTGASDPNPMPRLRLFRWLP